MNFFKISDEDFLNKNKIKVFDGIAGSAKSSNVDKIFKAYDLDEIMEREPKLGKYMYHEVVFMMTIATAFTRLNKTEKAEQMIKDMWNELKEYNPKLEAKIRKKSLATTMNLPGIVGRNIGLAGYRISRKFVTFN